SYSVWETSSLQPTHGKFRSILLGHSLCQEAMCDEGFVSPTWKLTRCSMGKADVISEMYYGGR
ncbi:hypothetical protein Bpfe_017891, partial [Biomphalaria pfeifferi]